VTSLSILLVDDDVDFAELMAEALRDEGHRVAIARTAAAAQELAGVLRPDVVLLDLGLPDADGYSVARSLRGMLPPLTPIVVVTGRPYAPYSAEVDLMLTKPVPSDLFGGLLEFIRRRREHVVRVT
jgi:DNA-binding response OmpR family regulator